MRARLTYFFGPMDCGKSTLALQQDHNLRRAGRHGVLFTSQDRSGSPVISSRLGMSRPATEVTDTRNLYTHVQNALLDRPITYVIADEAQFYSPQQIEQLADITDLLTIDVAAYGIATDFRSVLFPGSARLMEIADSLVPLQVQAMCWCGQPARMNARLVNDVMVVEGEQVLVGDTVGDEVRYLLLCRPHFRARQTCPTPAHIETVTVS